MAAGLGEWDKTFMAESRRFFAIKSEVLDPDAATFTFSAQKTMYGGKRIQVGDVVFIFASENAGGAGLCARGAVTACEPVPRTPALRQTPRVTVTVRRDGAASRQFGRVDLRSFRGKPVDTAEAELDFKLYRQATDKIVGLSVEAGQFLARFFQEHASGQ